MQAAAHAEFEKTASGRGRPILVAALCAVVVGTLGGLMTDVGPWYRALHKPWFQPPDWLFAPAWTVIFACAAVAGALAWKSHPSLRRWAVIAGMFAANGVFNILWSALFFRLHRPDWALPEVAALWLSIAALIVALRPVTRTGSWLMFPYLAWVSFAAFLNYVVVQENTPFTGS